MAIIAFDCFDTLLHRNCHNERIIFEWAREISIFFSFEISVQEIYSCRKKAEAKLKENAEDISYYELIGKVYDDLTNQSDHKDLSRNEFISKSLHYECEIEKKHLYCDENNIKLLKESHKNGNKVIVISDFYLPKKFFLMIFDYFSLVKYIDEIFVSSEIGKRKSTGHLYEYIIKKYRICPNEMTMIGDNKKSDDIIPRKIGIKTIFVPYKNTHFLYTPKMLKRNINKISKSNFESVFSGYSAALLLFCYKLYKKALLDNASKLLFCAREGQNLKKLFDIFQDKMYPHHKIATEYFYVSRKATLVPSLNDFENEKFDRIFRQYKEILAKDFLLSIGFNSQDIIKISAHNIELNAILSKDSYIFKSWARDPIFLNIYEKNRIKQKELFRQYVKNINDGKTDKIFLVDIGWKGTIQDNIYEVFEKKSEITGYYFGLFEHCDSDKNIKNGLMFDEEYKNYDYSVFSYSYVDLEKIFAADHGQTLGYTKNNCGKVIPYIKSQNDDIEIYNYVSIWQNRMNEDFTKLCKMFAESVFMPDDFYIDIASNYLKTLCCSKPHFDDVYLNLRKKAKENFGNISGAKLKKELSFARDKKMKKDYMYVDYSYRILNKLHLKCLYPIAWLYCKTVYFIKIIFLRVTLYERKIN